MLDKDKLAKALGLDKETQNTLDAGNAHPVHCTCETCKRWWQAMGPEDDPRGPYGPFTIEEIEDDTPDGQRCKRIRKEFLKDQTC